MIIDESSLIVMNNSAWTYELLEKSDRRLFYDLKRDDHPLKSLLPRYKDYTENLRRNPLSGPALTPNVLKIGFLID